MVKDFMKNVPELARLENRKTPLDGIGLSPAQLLMSKRVVSFVPAVPSLFKPHVTRNVHGDLKKHQKCYHDRYGTRSLHPLEEG